MLKIKDFFIEAISKKLLLYYCRRSSNVKALHFPSQELPWTQGLLNPDPKRIIKKHWITIENKCFYTSN